VEDCAERLIRLLRDPEERVRMGTAGKERVRQEFLTLRELEDYLRMFASLAPP
jgi:trehalose synthase